MFRSLGTHLGHSPSLNPHRVWQTFMAFWDLSLLSDGNFVPPSAYQNSYVVFSLLSLTHCRFTSTPFFPLSPQSLRMRNPCSLTRLRWPPPTWVQSDPNATQPFPQPFHQLSHHSQDTLTISIGWLFFCQILYPGLYHLEKNSLLVLGPWSLHATVPFPFFHLKAHNFQQ